MLIAFVPDVRGRVPSSATQARPFAFAIAAFGYWLAMWVQGGGILSPAVVYTAALLFAAVWFVLGIFDVVWFERTNYKWFIVQPPLLWIGLKSFPGCSACWEQLLDRLTEWRPPQVIQPVSILSSPARVPHHHGQRRYRAGHPQTHGQALAAMADVKIPAITVKWSSITTGALVIVWVASSLAIFSAVSNQMGPVVTVAAAQSGIKHTTSSGQLGEGGQQGNNRGHLPATSSCRPR